MRDIFATLLATDALSRHYKSGLHPTLREAIAAELRFPAKSSGPTSQAGNVDPEIPNLKDGLERPMRKQA